MKHLWLVAFVLLPAAAVAQAELGKTVDDIELKKLDGTSVKLSDLRGEKGKFVVVHFWSRKCPTAKEIRLPKEKELAEFIQKHEDDVVFLPVSSYGKKSESAKQVAQACEDEKLGYSVTFDEDQEIARHFGAHTVSFTAILDRDGTLVFAGGLFDKNGEDWENCAVTALEELLAGKDVTNKKPRARG
ncbi:MAG: hypothetical protein A3F84_08835 [Candidatus Handelsmanbacteria bacterium RIFCSPLOWO2_12_FULL_64_10]|uniref:Thioredoxin domain-containing protein n=1 Tax=Handelsmanbacteria sp. (strain RIFCSPLOWO2_12_FULL_64_10) TaxID=1817868 RepID=A0A1F6CB97_HANXR|nr:MAG: hypothetical protein A3F84_08835 [Candidatus Handelsmanbacteria bacterium RIFCSPLOWO2_12_FULL_64_10]